MIYHSAAAAMMAVSTLAAQSVAVALSALAPLPVQVSDGVVSANSTLPAGPMTSGTGQVSVALPGPSPSGLSGASASWFTFANNNIAVVRLSHVLTNPALLPNFTGQAGPHEILVEFSSATPRTASLEIYRQTYLAPNALWPTVQIDIDNDGVFEITNLSTLTGAEFSVSFGPQPLLVRVLIDAALGSQLASHNQVSLNLLPDNDLTITQPVSTCRPISPPPPDFLLPSFGNLGVDLFQVQDPNEPSVMVLGLTAQPSFLGLNGTLPCVLLPAPDVVIFAPSGSFHLGLPLSVRPVTFYAQGVTLTPAGLRVTDGYCVTAN